MQTYDDYLSQPQAIPLETMQALHKELLLEVGEDADAREIYNDLLAAAARYAAIRGTWLQLTSNQQAQQDSARTACHNALIAHFNMLTRCLRQQGKAAHWRDALGYEEENRYNRKTIGDFGCYLVFVNGLLAR